MKEADLMERAKAFVTARGCARLTFARHYAERLS